MNNHLMLDEDIRAVSWQDLTRLKRKEVLTELALPFPWLILSLVFAAHEWYLPALAFSFAFFLAGLRVVHNAYHHTLGLPRWLTEWWMFAFSVLMLGSMHAIQKNHLRHHKYLMGPEDIEGESAQLSFWRAIAVGPIFPFRLHWKALQVSNDRQRRWIVAELAANVLLLMLVFGVLGFAPLRYHILAMIVGQSLTAFFAVWTVHHDLEGTETIARTLRHPLLNTLTLNLMYHVEHHLFPRVPTCHLPQLAERLDEIAPRLQEYQVLYFHHGARFEERAQS